MADAAIPVDLYNPGQVFACLGFLEAADVLLGDAEGGFDWSDPADTRFHLRAAGDENPVAVVLRFLVDARVFSISSEDTKHRTEKWKVQTLVTDRDDPFPIRYPQSPATLPALLRDDAGNRMVLDYWGDTTVRDPVKLWGGAGGNPGAALARDALSLAHKNALSFVDDPYTLSAKQDSSFRFDWRRDYIPIDAGFSPNKHGDVGMVGYPLVEILASIGVTNARPQSIDKLNYRYAVLSGAGPDLYLDPIFLRAALGCADLPFAMRRFRIGLGWPGQENQARCITDVVEENPQ